MPAVNIHAAKTQLFRLIDAAAAGAEVIIAQAISEPGHLHTADRGLARYSPLIHAI